MQLSLAGTVGCFISAWKIFILQKLILCKIRVNHHLILFTRSFLEGGFLAERVKSMKKLLIYVHPEPEKFMV